METVFIGFGSNQGNRIELCRRALTLLGLLPRSRVISVSSFYETEPVSDSTDPGEGWFVNGVVHLETELPAHRLLSILREIERALGRDLDHRGGPRPIDLDLLFYGNRVQTEPDLTVPHPRLHRRRFVLVPLADVAPDWIHPVLHQTVRSLLDALQDQAVVRPLDPTMVSASPAPPAYSRRNEGRAAG